MSERQTFRERIITSLFSHFPSLAERWAKSFDAVKSDEVPWTPFTKDIPECRVALVTTAGVHLESQEPFDMEDEKGDFSFREIPGDSGKDELMVTHKYYNHSGADRDINIIFPIDRLREMEASGEIGEVAPRHFGFMGHIVEGKVKGLMESSAPEVAKRLSDDGVDFVLLTPG